MAVLCAFLCVAPVASEEEYVTFFPLVARNHYNCAPDGWGDIMSNWKIIVPQPIINLCDNPSLEANVTTGWATVAPNTIAVSTTESAFGLHSLLCTYQGSGSLAYYAITLPTATTDYSLSCRAYPPANWDGSSLALTTSFFAGSSETIVSQWDTTTTDEWILLETTLTVAADVIGQVYVTTTGAPTAGRFVYIDGFQIEELSERTTYCDGDQPGCWWNVGTPHLTTSERAAMSRAGGTIEDLKDDYNFGVREIAGAGAAQVTPSIDSFSLLPGGQLNNIKTNWRTFTMTGVLRGTDSDCDLHQTRQNLLLAIEKDAYPQDETGYQPVLIRYTGADVEKEIAAHYSAGLEANIGLEERIHEIAAIRWVSPDPFWYATIESAQLLDSNDSDTFRIVAARLRSTGQWDSLGPPNVAGTYTQAYAVVVGPTQEVFWGGDFTNFNNDLDADRIVKWDGTTWSWPAGEGVDDGIVYALVVGVDDLLYVGGSFTAVSGAMANTNRIAAWDDSTSTWSALGTSSDDADVYALAVDKNGYIYAGGNFTGMGGVGNTNRIAYWDGAAWNALSNGVDNNSVIAIAVGLDNTIYVGGTFSTVDGGSAYVRIAYWDGSAWGSMGDANNIVNELVVDPVTGDLYAGGVFTIIGGVTVNGLARWNGTIWENIGDGLPSPASVRSIALGPDRLLYVSLGFGDGLWVGSGNGGDWVNLDWGFPAGVSELRQVAFGIQDPTVPSNYDIYVCHDQSATIYYAGTATATNNGTAPVYPQFIVERSGGTSANIQSLRNETIGKQLFIDYDLLDGERLTITMMPGDKSVESSFFGPRPDAVLALSDSGDWLLQPGANQVTCFVDVAGAPTITAWLQWRDAYNSFD